MRVRIRGKAWRLVFTKLPPSEDGMATHGLCDDPTTKRKRIRIDRALSAQPLLDVICHEVAHAALWDLSEGAIDSLSSAIAHHLWDQGVRPQQRATRRTEELLRQTILDVIWSRGELAAIDEKARAELAAAQARLLRRLGWAHQKPGGDAQ